MRLTFILGLLLGVRILSYSQGYYPLEIGNRWDYGYLDVTPGELNHFVYQRTVSVVADTMMPNGKQYASLSDGSYLRQEGDIVYSYSALQGEHILYDFSRQDGDTTFAYYPTDTLITIVYRGSGTIFGRLTTAWIFNTCSSRSSFYSFISIVDSFGYFHGKWEPGETEYCLGAIINGVQYGTITGATPPRDMSPIQFSLSQNYPNPFNPTTMISYTVPVRVLLRLTIYDILGRVVSVLQEGVHDPGNYRVRFDGSRLSSGMYIYQLHSDRFSQTRSMLLVK